MFGKILKNELYESYYAECHDFSKVVARTLKEFRVGSEDEVQVSKFEAIFKAVFPECGRAEVEKVMGKSVFPIRGEELAYFMEKYKLALK